MLWNFNPKHDSVMEKVKKWIVEEKEDGTSPNIKALNKGERFVCEITWGGVPTDVSFVRESKLFQSRLEEFKSGKWSELYKSETPKQIN